jgi:hypothetical protein
MNKNTLEKMSKDKLIEEFLKKQDELIRLDKEKEALEKELRKYKNPNTPPSANQHLKPSYSKTVEVKTHKRGAPFDHQGTNRARKETPNERHIFGKECPQCLSKSFNVVGQKIQPE